jgi:hypothetical protein
MSIRISIDVTGINNHRLNFIHCLAIDWRGINMFLSTKKWAVLVASGALMAGAIAPAMAQGAGGGASNDNTTETAKPAAPRHVKTSKADRKEARKEARAKKNGELKKLEATGYKPSENDTKYPNNIQKAQDKAGIGQAASQ